MVQVTFLGKSIDIYKATDTGMGYVICEYTGGTCVLSDLSSTDQAKVRSMGITLSPYAQQKLANQTNTNTSTGQAAAATAAASTDPRDRFVGPDYPGLKIRDFMVPKYLVVFPNSLRRDQWFIDGHGIVGSDGNYSAAGGSYTTKSQLPAGTTIGGIPVGGVPASPSSFQSGGVSTGVIAPILPAISELLKVGQAAVRTSALTAQQAVTAAVGTATQVQAAVMPIVAPIAKAEQQAVAAATQIAAGTATKVVTAFTPTAQAAATAAGTAVGAFTGSAAGTAVKTATSAFGNVGAEVQAQAQSLVEKSKQAVTVAKTFLTVKVLGILALIVGAIVVAYFALRDRSRRSTYGRY